MSSESQKDLKAAPPGIDVPPVSDENAPAKVKKLPEVTDTSPSMESAPTDSHALATQDHEDKGASQLDHSEPEVKDLGWDKVPEHIPAPLVGGLPNDELWVLVRRFNKVV
jgi:Protein of unknown function (DUF3292)